MVAQVQMIQMWVPLIFFSSLLLSLFIQLCPARQCESIQETLPQDVVHDIGAAFYIHTCSRQTNCSVCSDDDGSQTIHEASVCAVETNGKCSETPLPQPYSGHDFTVHLPAGQFDHSGMFDYKLDYKYSCENKSQNTKNSYASLCSQAFGLNLRVTDFKLEVITESQGMTKDVGNDFASVSLSEGSSVTLECSSGLENSIDIPVHFVFMPDSNPDTETRMVCEAYDQKQDTNYNGSWTVVRQLREPFSCQLHIDSISANEGGTYECVAILPHGIVDWSDRNVSIVIEQKITGAQSGSSDQANLVRQVVTGLSGFFGVCSFAVLLAFCFVISYSVRRHRHRRINDENPPLRPPAAPAATAAPTVAVARTLSAAGGQYGALRDTESLVDQRNIEDGPEMDIEDDAQTLVNTSSLTSRSGLNGGSLAAATGTGAQSSPPIGAPTENRIEVQADIESSASVTPKAQYTLTEHGQQPSGSPANLLPQETTNYTEGNIIDSDQMTLDPQDGKIPKIVIPSTPEVSPSPQESGPPSSGGESSEGNQFDMSMSESGGSGDDHPSHTSTTSTTSQLSEETLAVKMYHDQTHLSPALGTTPDSDFPVDQNFTCPYCKKQYRVRQRQWFTRHMEECQAKNT